MYNIRHSQAHITIGSCMRCNVYMDEQSTCTAPRDVIQFVLLYRTHPTLLKAMHVRGLPVHNISTIILTTFTIFIHSATVIMIHS
jgi:hypothetical protein